MASEGFRKALTAFSTYGFSFRKASQMKCILVPYTELFYLAEI